MPVTNNIVIWHFRGRKRFVSEGDGGHIKPEIITFRNWKCYIFTENENHTIL